MKPEQEKAKELFDKMLHCQCKDGYVRLNVSRAKNHAIIAVDEILLNIEATKLYHPESKSLGFNQQYWEEVKQEIEKI